MTPSSYACRLLTHPDRPPGRDALADDAPIITPINSRVRGRKLAGTPTSFAANYPAAHCARSPAQLRVDASQHRRGLRGAARAARASTETWGRCTNRCDYVTTKPLTAAQRAFRQCSRSDSVPKDPRGAGTPETGERIASGRLLQAQLRRVGQPRIKGAIRSAVTANTMPENTIRWNSGAGRRSHLGQPGHPTGRSGITMTTSTG